MSDLDDMSFEILGTTPTNSYIDNRSLGLSSAVRTDGLEADLLSRMRLSTTSSTGSLGPPPKSPLSPHSNKENRQDVAMDILLRRKSPSADVLRNLVSCDLVRSTHTLILSSPSCPQRLPSLSAEFPSLSSAQLTEEDLHKLQTIVAEHQQLRENLVKANAVIKTYFGAVEKWQTDVQQSKEADRRSLVALQEHNQRLQQQLKEAGGGVETVPRETYKNVERQCSQLLAENLQFKDMEQQFKDEIHCLRVNQASTEELVRMGQLDLQAERAACGRLEGDLRQAREENEVLVQQAEIYKKDFLAERDARQRMAGEKEAVLQELNRLRMMLSATPQQQQQTGGGVGVGSAAAGHCGLVRFMCPNCYSVFSSQQSLSQHLPQCGHHS